MQLRDDDFSQVDGRMLCMTGPIRPTKWHQGVHQLIIAVFAWLFARAQNIAEMNFSG